LENLNDLVKKSSFCCYWVRSLQT